MQLCKDCRELMFTDDIGVCKKCHRETESGTFALCGSCAEESKCCQACLEPISGA